MKHKLSIITINKDNKEGLQKTILSILNQDYKNFEYIIIDGGSDDGSKEVIEKYSDRITYYISEPDKGIYNAMNKGILKANGNYLLFINSGDWLAGDDVLSRVFSINRTSDILYGHFNYITGDYKRVRKACVPDELTLSYFFGNSVCHPASFIARKLFEAGLYDESYKIAADKKFFIENIVLKNCSVERLDLVISNFNTDGISSNPKFNLLIREENKRILEELFVPRLNKDIVFLKENYSDSLSFTRIRRYKILYAMFKALKKTSVLFNKIF